MALAFDEGEEPGELTAGTALTEIIQLHSLMSEKIETLPTGSLSRAQISARHHLGSGRRTKSGWCFVLP